MAFTFPLQLTEFMEILPIAAMTLDLPEAVQMSRTAGGALLSADIGDRLWTASVELGPMTRGEAQLVLARLSLLRPSGRSALITDKGASRPLLDPTGSLLGSTTPEIDEISGDRRELRLGGLPEGYRLSPGDRISFVYGSDPTRYAMHQLVEAGTAGTTGRTGLIEVDPVLRDGVSAGRAVRLISPVFKARLVPGSVDPGRRRATLTEGVRFELQQMIGV